MTHDKHPNPFPGRAIDIAWTTAAAWGVPVHTMDAKIDSGEITMYTDEGTPEASVLALLGSLGVTDVSSIAYPKRSEHSGRSARLGWIIRIWADTTPAVPVVDVDAIAAEVEAAHGAPPAEADRDKPSYALAREARAAADAGDDQRVAQIADEQVRRLLADGICADCGRTSGTCADAGDCTTRINGESTFTDHGEVYVPHVATATPTKADVEARL